ncbi:MAG TPA: complex I NDUFA9 subunit family protein [Thermoanaerobaculaceae bacterium]|nr:complex I NDUFA9 subunit family protein [Thermoanaerobaculaceae bacterium]
MARTPSSRRKSAPTPQGETHAPPKADSRRLLLTGASGFMGRHLLSTLLDEGWEVVAVSRRPDRRQLRPGVIEVAADLNGDGWQDWATGCVAAINLVGIIRELPRRGVTFSRIHEGLTAKVLDACKRLGIPRILQMSALGARPNAPTAYHRTKFAAEELVRASGLRWTIFRPSLIFGPGDGFEQSIVPVMRRLPVFPVFGDGRAMLQPVAVNEVARCFVAALERPGCESQVFELGGPQEPSYDEVLRRIARALGLRRRLVHLPVGLSRFLVSVLEHLPGSPISRDQLTMLLEGSTCEIAATSLAFGVPQARYEGPVWLRPASSLSPAS